MPKKNYNYVVILLFIVLFLGVSLSSLYKSASYDEFGHLSRGILYLKTGFLFDTGHPPLANIIQALPVVLFLNPSLPDDYYNLYVDNNYDLFARRWIYTQKYSLDTILFFGRLPVILFSLLGGLFIFKWAKELYNVRAGLFSLALYSIHPLILTNSRLIHTDMISAIFTFISLYFFWRFMKFRSIRSLVFTSIFFGLAISSRFTALMLIPIFLFFLFIDFMRDKNKTKGSKKTIKRGLFLLTSFLAILLISFLFLGSSYLFKGSFNSLADNLRNDNTNYVDHSRFNSETISVMIVPEKIGFLRGSMKKIIEDVPIILPYPFLKDYWLIMGISSDHPTFINGNLINGTVWYFYPEIFLITNPIPFLILIVLSFFAYFYSNKKFEALFLLFPIFFLFVYFTFFHPLQITIRYLLPAYFFLFVFIGSNIFNLGFKDRLHKKIYTSFILLLLLWGVVNAVIVFPHYDSFFNGFVGQDNGYRYYVGFDDGQDMLGLEDYVKKNNLQNIKFSYEGVTDPSYYNINYDYLPSHGILEWKEFAEKEYEVDCSPDKGVIAVSVTNLKAYEPAPDCFDWLGGYEPSARIGYTIFIYNVR